MEGWADGGVTDVANMQVLCPPHHDQKTQGRLQASIGPDGLPTYRTRNGLRLKAEAPYVDQAEDLHLLERERTQPDDPPF